MKVQHIAVIFIIIILPIAMVMASYIGSQIDTITLQTNYDTKLTDATYDAISALQINTVNNRYSSVSDSKIRDIEASINTFYNSMLNNEQLLKEEMQAYTPALVYTLYDGYYIYSKYDNMYPENNGYVYTNENDANTVYGLKPYIYYACRYKDSGRNFVVNYTLDNAIKIYGTFRIDGKEVYKTLSGYLINPETIKIPENIVDSSGNLIASPRDWKLTYDIDGKHNDNDTITIEPEILTEHLLFADETQGDYNYVTYNGQKIYYEKNSTVSSKMYFIYQNYAKQYITNTTSNNTMFQYLKNRTYEGSLHSTSAFEYYYNAKKFSEEVISLTKGITQENAIDENGEKINFEVTTGDSEIFVANTENDPLISYSIFDENRREVIKNSIKTNLITAIAQYNIYSSNSYEFSLPEFSVDDWEKITTNVSVISFLQGLPIGHKYYNNYCILTNNNNEENIKRENIYVITQNTTTKAREYHSAGCKHLLEESEDKIIVAYSNLNFIRQTVRISENNYMYFYPQNISNNKITSCYYCMVNATDAYTINEIIKGKITEEDEETGEEKVKYNVSLAGTQNERYKKIREEYIKALARESYDLNQVEMDAINDVKEADINSEVKEETKVTVNPINLSLHKGETKTISATVTPADTKISWYSEDTNTVKVDQNGNVTAIKEGKAVIRVVAQDGSGASATCNVTVEDDLVTKININPTELTLDTGDIYTLQYEVEPSNATHKKVTWTSSDENIAKVEYDTGKITAKNPGDVVITATAQDASGVKAECNVHVKIADVKVTGLTLNKTNINLKVGETFKLKPTVTPDHATNPNVIFENSNPEFATVSNDGLITAIKAGKTVITVKTTDESNIQRKCTVTVSDNKSISITLEPKTIELYSGGKSRITATVTPDYAENKTLTWYSTNTDVATIDQNGNIVAIAPGETEIVAWTMDGGRKHTSNECIITVKPRTITLNKTYINLYKGDTATISATITPNNTNNNMKKVTPIWTSSNPTVATIDSNGNITAKSIGTTEITVKGSDGSTCSQKCIVSVNRDYEVEISNMKFDITERLSSNKRSFNSVTSKVGFTIEKKGNISVTLQKDYSDPSYIVLKYIIRNTTSKEADYGVTTYCNNLGTARYYSYRKNKRWRQGTERNITINCDNDTGNISMYKTTSSNIITDLILGASFDAAQEDNEVWMGTSKTNGLWFGDNQIVDTSYSYKPVVANNTYNNRWRDKLNKTFNTWWEDDTTTTVGLTWNWQGTIKAGETIEKRIPIRVYNTNGS